jgi:hypothetical protein
MYVTHIADFLPPICISNHLNQSYCYVKIHMAPAQDQKKDHTLAHIGAWTDQRCTVCEATETMTIEDEVIFLVPHPILEQIWSMDPAILLAEFMQKINLAGIETRWGLEKAPGSMLGTTLLGTLSSSKRTICAHEE